MTKQQANEIIKKCDKKDFNKISEFLDYFTAVLITNNPNADIITINQFVLAIKTNYFFKYWKYDEFDMQIIATFNELYEKIDPIVKNWPKLKDKYEDLTEAINQVINTSGDSEICQDEPTPKDIKNYIVSILTQSANYTVNSNKTNQINRNLIEDVEKILSLPHNRQLINISVLSLQPYVYDKPVCPPKCCCSKCGGIQKFDPNAPYFNTLMRRLDDLERRMGYYEWKKVGPVGPAGPTGPTGPKGDKGDAGQYSFDNITIKANNKEELSTFGVLSEADQTKYFTYNDIDNISNKVTKNTGDIGELMGVKFSATEFQRLKKILEQSAFKINKNKPTDQLEHAGFFTPQTLYSDLDKPNDNMVTDSSGEALKIRKINNFNYAQQMWFNMEDDNNPVMLEGYQGKVTYKGKELNSNSEVWKKVGTLNDVKTIILFNEWKPNQTYRLSFYQNDKNDQHLNPFKRYIYFKSTENVPKQGVMQPLFSYHNEITDMSEGIQPIKSVIVWNAESISYDYNSTDNIYGRLFLYELEELQQTSSAETPFTPIGPPAVPIPGILPAPEMYSGQWKIAGKRDFQGSLVIDKENLIENQIYRLIYLQQNSQTHYDVLYFKYHENIGGTTVLKNCIQYEDRGGSVLKPTQFTEIQFKNYENTKKITTFTYVGQGGLVKLISIEVYIP